MGRLAYWQAFNLFYRLSFVVPISLLVNLTRHSWIAVSRGLPICEYQAIALIRTFLTSLTPSQILYVSPSTSRTYHNWISTTSQNSMLKPPISASTTSLSARAGQLHWIELRNVESQKVLFLLHGGGYNAPLTSAHLDWCYTIIETCWKDFKVPVAAAILEYSLTPDHQFPTQLRQARDGLEQLFERGFKPENIVVGGDSAGGNLAMGLLSHLMHPHPRINSLTIEKPLSGVFLASPWLTDDMTTESFRENAMIDMLSPELVSRSVRNLWPISALLKGFRPEEDWVYPLNARAEWWDKLDTVATRLYITVGEQEMFRDVVDFVLMLRDRCRAFAREGDRLTLHVGHNESHDHILTMFMMHRTNHSAINRMLSWMEDVFTD